MKDVPTALPIGIVQAAVLKEPTPWTFWCTKEILIFLLEGNATGSLRRQAQWFRYPNHKVVDLRGNVNTRMQKLHESWSGCCFAAAGLERIKLKTYRLY
jgi:hydroxymethylbilane synthase